MVSLFAFTLANVRELLSPYVTVNRGIYIDYACFIESIRMCRYDIVDFMAVALQCTMLVIHPPSTR